MSLAALITTKKMSKEEFEEREHPRHGDGKFRKKNEGVKSKEVKAKKKKEKEGGELLSRENLNKRNVAIGAVTLAGAYAGYKITKNSNVFKKMGDPKRTREAAEDIISGAFDKKNNPSPTKKKGLAFLFKTKAMSKEEFEEHEHPRGPDGQFIDSGKAGAAPKTPKGKHGGKRSFSGRTSKYASIAVPKRMAQYKKAYPDASQKEIEKMIRKDSVEMGKPDWAEYLDSPEEYLKKEEKMREAAYRSKYNKAKLPGRGYITIKGTPGESGEAKASVAETKAAFDKEVAKQQIMRDAWSTYRNEYSDQDSRNRAKLVLLAGGVATILGVAALTVGRPKFGLQGGLKNMEDLKGLRHMDFDGQSLQIRRLTDKGAPDIAEAVPAEFIQFAKVTGKENWTEMEKVGAVNKWVTKAIMKASRMTPEEGAKYGMRLGPKWSGYNVRRFRLDNKYIADLSDDASRANYIPDFGDLDVASGKSLVWRDGTLKYRSMLQEALRKEARAGKKDLLNKITGKSPKGIDRPIKVDTKNLRVEFARNKENVSFAEDDLKKWLDAKGMIGDGGIPTKKSGIMPEAVVRNYTPEQLAERTAMAGKDDYKGYNKFIAGPFMGMVSRRAMAGVSITTGTGGMYYFQQDVSSFLNAKIKADESRAKQQEELDKMNAPAKKPQGDKKASADEIKKINAQTKLEEARLRRELAQHGKELNRANFLQRLVDLDIRRNFKGSQKLHSTRPGTVAERFTKAVDELYQLDKNPENSIYVRERTKNQETTSDFVEEVKQKFDERFGPGSLERVLNGESINKVTASKGFDGDVVTKAYEEDEEEETVSIEEIAEVAALQVIQEITDISQSCKMMIEGGVPGHTKYEAINDIVTDIYINLKRKVKEEEYDGMSSGETNSEKTIEKSTNPVDIKGSGDYMSSQDDRSAGLFVPTEDAKFCSLCNKPVSTDDIAQCDNPECPFTWLDAVIGDTDIDDKKDKEEQSDGQKQEGTEKISQASGE